jgi:exosome complex component RRP4
MTRKIVLPGTPVGDTENENKRPGRGTFKEGTTIYAAVLGIVNDKGKYIDIIPLSGVYDPQQGDTVIAVVQESLRSAWMMDINAPYPAFLNVANAPWRVEMGETAKFLKTGDVVIAQISGVDESRSIDLTMKCKPCRRIEDGIVIDIEPSKVPRVIGKNSSMLNVLKQHTNCWMFVGQNGRVWIKGDDAGISRLIDVIHVIEEESHTAGLTQRITRMLGG